MGLEDKDKPKPGSCRRESVVYTMTCKSCKERGVLSCYYGETSRTAYLRGKEHAKGQESKQEDNALLKHDELHHDGDQGLYIMRIVQSHKRAVTRQVQEAVMIDRSKANVIMNSKSRVQWCTNPTNKDGGGRQSLDQGLHGQWGPSPQCPPRGAGGKP